MPGAREIAHATHAGEPYTRLLDRGAQVVAIALFLGYVSIPIAVLLGYGREYVDAKIKTAALQTEAATAAGGGQ